MPSGNRAHEVHRFAQDDRDAQPASDSSGTRNDSSTPPPVSKVTTTTSSSARARPAACSPTGCRPIPQTRVLLLEAGGADNWIWFHIPVGYLFAIGNPRADWMFETETEPGLNGRALNYPRGKVIGGCSAINAMISMRGQAADYDHWRQLGLTGWGWDDVLPGLQAARGPFPRRHRASRRRRRMAGRAAARALGRPGRRRRGGDRDGHPGDAGLQHRRQHRRRLFPRQPEARPCAGRAARGLPEAGAATRPNLRLETGVLVEQRAVRRQARGRRALPPGRPARRGAGQGRGASWRPAPIGSPQILQLSGVGPADWLGELGIAVVHDRPGVGGNLQDHLQQRAIYKVHGVKTLNETYHSLIGRAADGRRNTRCSGAGPLTMAPSQLGIFTTLLARPRAGQHPVPRPAAVARQVRRAAAPLPRRSPSAPATCGPTSRGTIRLRSADPAAKPLIAPNYLATDEDRRVAADAIRVTRRLMQPAGAAALPAGGIPARARASATTSLAGQGRRRHRHHDLPSRRHGQDGPAVRPDGGGRRAAARHRPRAACA